MPCNAVKMLPSVPKYALGNKHPTFFLSENFLPSSQTFSLDSSPKKNQLSITAYGLLVFSFHRF